MKRLVALVVLALLPVAAFAHGDDDTAFGRPGDPKKATRVVKVEMSDRMRFSPDAVTVWQGETVRFVPRNDGRIEHEMVLGTPQELEKHAALMRKFPGMEHDDPNMVSVAPGKSGEIVWQFTQPGEFRFACLEPGHFEAGMVGTIVVAAAGEAGHGGMQKAEQKAGDAKSSDAIVRKVDKEAKKITLRHGPLPELGMDEPMTMVYRVKDAALLDKVKAGDKVKFHAENAGGVFTITKIERAQ